MSMTEATAPRGTPCASSSGRALSSSRLTSPSAKTTSSSTLWIATPSHAARCTGRSSGATSTPSRNTRKWMGASPAGALNERLPSVSGMRRNSRAARLPTIWRADRSVAMKRPIGSTSIIISISWSRSRNCASATSCCCSIRFTRSAVRTIRPVRIAMIASISAAVAKGASM